MGLLSNNPQGFSEAVSMLNALPQSVLAELCEDVMAFLQYKAGFLNTEVHQSNFERVQTSSDQCLKAETCINALTYIFRAAALSALSIDEFVGELKSSLLFQDSTLIVLKAIWKAEGDTLSSLPKQSLSIGELFSMDWSLGVSLSSNSCRSLNTPHLKLQLKLAETREEMKIKNVEMSLAEFQNFASQLKEMSNALETA